MLKKQEVVWIKTRISAIKLKVFIYVFFKSFLPILVLIHETTNMLALEEYSTTESRCNLREDHDVHIFNLIGYARQIEYCQINKLPNNMKQLAKNWPVKKKKVTNSNQSRVRDKD